MPLGNFATLQRGFDITKAQQADGPYPVISSSGLKSRHADFMVRGPGVVIGRKGTLGTAFYVGEDYWPHDTTLWVKDFHDNDPKFAYYLLKSLNLERYDCGASNPTLNRNHIHGLPIMVPSVATQERIASILSAYDDLIENNTRRIAILEEMARALYQEWFVHFRFPGHEHVPLVDASLGPIPEGWQLKAASEVLDVDPKIRSDKEALKPFVPMSGLSEHSMLISDVQTKETKSGARFQNGDTLLARITPCLENGKTGYVDFLPSDSDVAHGSTEFIVLRGRAVCSEFVYLLARSDIFRDHAIKSMSGATGRQRVRNECFKTFYLAEPDQATMAGFKTIVEPMFQAVLLLAKKNENLRTTRDLLLPKLISGEIDVSALEAPIAEAAD
jgi:type I restriction enzyme S subunit